MGYSLTEIALCSVALLSVLICSSVFAQSTLKKTALYFAFHKDTNPEFIARMNQALETLKQADSNGKSEFGALVERCLGKKEK
ncbi:MAG: hypothetical protein GY801_50725 [bacterium]|nr:hypothetical protein [bacterium]